ncbi:hypothetical protein Poli38472_009005 [Pythium oligandrum]|uniref:RING-type domain-containing protein n=1 Tax=Pythium oligandrum TaxID=41045 RepID=A0A8K1CM40_PYTOL|nr:hypothetical protein Poli38472_009005 [Pythium oligandrum]|eukprot:TMW64838.1 hypothetical protein Poli38472_009005 [Pythium oligandrum]
MRRDVVYARVGGVSTRLLLLSMTLMVWTTHVTALIIERPFYSVMTHVSGEFTDADTLHDAALTSKEVIPVTPFHACEPISTDLSGRIALVQRGDCNFVKKVYNAQRAGAIGVVVMDNAARDEAPHHIIMQKDENATQLTIPGVFVAYRDGERLLHFIRKAAPWTPALVTINEVGEMPQDRTKYRFWKRAVAYIFLVSVVCALSSGLSIISSFLFGFVGTLWRSRVTRKLPVIHYVPHLQAELLERALRDAHILDRIVLDDDDGSTPETEGNTDNMSAAVDENEENTSGESCSICLDDFVVHDRVKVLPCQHFFHVDCIDPWLEFRSGRCPLCKQDAISALDEPPKSFFGFTLPRLEQVLRQEHWFHTFFLMLPASLVSCLIVNAAASVIRGMWP